MITGPIIFMSRVFPWLWGRDEWPLLVLGCSSSPTAGDVEAGLSSWIRSWVRSAGSSKGCPDTYLLTLFYDLIQNDGIGNTDNEEK